MYKKKQKIALNTATLRVQNGKAGELPVSPEDKTSRKHSSNTCPPAGLDAVFRSHPIRKSLVDSNAVRLQEPSQQASYCVHFYCIINMYQIS